MPRRRASRCSLLRRASRCVLHLAPSPRPRLAGNFATLWGIRGKQVRRRAMETESVLPEAQLPATRTRSSRSCSNSRAPSLSLKPTAPSESKFLTPTSDVRSAFRNQPANCPTSSLSPLSEELTPPPLPQVGQRDSASESRGRRARRRNQKPDGGVPCRGVWGVVTVARGAPRAGGDQRAQAAPC